MTKKEKKEAGMGRGCSPRSGNERRKCFPKEEEWEGGSCVTVTSKMLHLSSQVFPKKKVPRRSEEGKEIGAPLDHPSHSHHMVHWAGAVLSTRAEHGKGAPKAGGARSEPPP